MTGIGYRVGRIVGGQLLSPIMTDLSPWPAMRGYRAACPTGHRAPAPGCQCGVWLTQDQRYVDDWLARYDAQLAAGGTDLRVSVPGPLGWVRVMVEYGGEVLNAGLLADPLAAVGWSRAEQVRVLKITTVDQPFSDDLGTDVSAILGPDLV